MEGLLTIALSLVSKWIIADWPNTANFLNPEEKALLFKRLEMDGGFAKMDKLDMSTALIVLKDWKIWAGSVQCRLPFL